jgi:hypothetical protein
MITASVVQDWMYRGSNYRLIVSVEESDEDDTPYVIPNTAVGKLRLSQSWGFATSELEKDADTYIRANGIIEFYFIPEETEDLLSGGWDLSIHLEDGDEVIPVFQGRFGIVAFNPPASTGGVV